MLLTQPLVGRHVELEPLAAAHRDDLVTAADGDRASFAWTAVPDGPVAVGRYVEAALDAAARRVEMPFAVRRRGDGRIVGSTRYLNIEHWSAIGVGAAGVDAGDRPPSTVEIGATWYAPDAQGTAVNPEAKRLLLAHAFEVWGVQRVQFRTDARNRRSRAAIEKLGARFEGVLRHLQPGMGASGSSRPARDTAVYSILPEEWPAVRAGLDARLARHKG